MLAGFSPQEKESLEQLAQAAGVSLNTLKRIIAFIEDGFSTKLEEKANAKFANKVMKQVSSKLKSLAAEKGLNIDLDEFERMLEEQLGGPILRKRTSTNVSSQKRAG